MTVGLAASVLALAGLAGGMWLVAERSRVQRRATAAVALAEAHRLHKLARGAENDDPARWAEAAAAVEGALGLLAQGGEPRQKREADELKTQITSDHGAVQKETEWSQRLVDIRATKAEDEHGSSADVRYGAVFREIGIDPDGTSAEEAASKIRSRRPVPAQGLVAALDDWAAVRRGMRGDWDGSRRLLGVARAADPDHWRDDLRECLAKASGADRTST
jgi:serine/threonine-protein kinase